MASYHIIGGDQKEYGPISAEDVNLWIAEGRLNAQSQARTGDDPQWRPLGTFPEFAAAFRTAPPTIAPLPPSTGTTAPASTDFLERDYELDIGGCVTGGWALLKNNFGTLFVGFLCVAAIFMVASLMVNGLVMLMLPGNSLVIRQIFHFLGAALLAPVAGPLMGSLYYLFIRANRNEPTAVGDVFIGFQQNFKALVLGYLVVAIIGGLCMAPYSYLSDARLTPIIDQMRNAAPADIQALMPQMWSVLFAMMPVLLVCMIPLTYLTINLQFTLPLILDKQMDFWPAMKTSWKMVHKHWWQLFGLSIVLGLVSVAGLIGCCIGVVVTIPIAFGAAMIAYETIFGARKR